MDHILIPAPFGKITVNRKHNWSDAIGTKILTGVPTISSTYLYLNIFHKIMTCQETAEKSFTQTISSFSWKAKVCQQELLIF